MNAQHTPGPWVFHEQIEPDEYCLLQNDERWVIGFRQNGELLTDEQMANAHLIAASPDLLRTLEAIKESQEDENGGCIGDGWVWNVARQAITKARGEL